MLILELFSNLEFALFRHIENSWATAQGGSNVTAFLGNHCQVFALRMEQKHEQ